MNDARYNALQLAVQFHGEAGATSADVVGTASMFADFLQAASTTAPAAAAGRTTTRGKASDKTAENAETGNKQTLDPGAATVESATSETAGTVASTDTKTSTMTSPSDVTIEKLREAATLYSQGPAGVEGLVAVFGEFGVANLSAIKPEQYAAVYARLNEQPAAKDPLA